jgi:hypothetical protein
MQDHSRGPRIGARFKRLSRPEILEVALRAPRARSLRSRCARPEDDAFMSNARPTMTAKRERQFSMLSPGFRQHGDRFHRSEGEALDAERHVAFWPRPRVRSRS